MVLCGLISCGGNGVGGDRAPAAEPAADGAVEVGADNPAIMDAHGIDIDSGAAVDVPVDGDRGGLSDRPLIDSIHPSTGQDYYPLCNPDAATDSVDMGAFAADGSCPFGGFYTPPSPPDTPDHYLGVTQMIVGPDGNLWVAISSFDPGHMYADRLMCFAPGGPLLDVPLQGHEVLLMAAGHDGAVWFSTGTTVVGRITPAGDLTTFDTATQDPPDMSPPVFLAPGPDGQMWFTSFGDLGPQPEADVVGRISSAGKVTKVVLPPIQNPDCSHRDVGSLTTGPDGNVWIGTGCYAGVLRMAPDFSFTEFPISDRLGEPVVISGPDGNIWVSGGGLPGIVRVTPEGMMTTFPVQDINGGGSPSAVDLTVGPDGAIWFATENQRSIGRLTVDGMDTSYFTPFLWYFTYNLDNVDNIVTGPDGNLWFTVADGIAYYRP
jgi:virginiamycin B lyase